MKSAAKLPETSDTSAVKSMLNNKQPYSAIAGFWPKNSSDRSQKGYDILVKNVRNKKMCYITGIDIINHLKLADNTQLSKL